MLSDDMFNALVHTEISHPRSDEERGSVFQRDRIHALADRACRNRPGDLVEIGCYAGGTSERLAEVARRHGRKLVCVDNWLPGGQYELPLIRKAFVDSMQKWSDVLIVIDADAHLPEIIERIRERRYCFAFSDDGHTFNAHLTELRTLLPITDGLVAVDDIYEPEVRQAIDAALVEFPEWREVAHEGLRESWLVKR